MCNICNQTFAPKGLSMHMKIHSTKNSFPCNICGKHFTQGASSMKHEKSHQVEKKYQCMICLKNYKSSNTLFVHKKIHLT